MLCFGSLVQINWQDEAERARRLQVEKHVPAEVLQEALSSTDVEQPLESADALVQEQTGAYIVLLTKPPLLLLHKLYPQSDMLRTILYLLLIGSQACVIVAPPLDLLCCPQGSCLKLLLVQAQLFP